MRRSVFPPRTAVIGIFGGLSSIFFVHSPAAAQTAAIPVEIAWFTLGMGWFGGLALFLASLDMLSEGLKRAAGDTLKMLLSKMTSNRLLGAATGALSLPYATPLR